MASSVSVISPQEQNLETLNGDVQPTLTKSAGAARSLTSLV